MLTSIFFNGGRFNHQLEKITGADGGRLLPWQVCHRPIDPWPMFLKVDA